MEKRRGDISVTFIIATVLIILGLIIVIYLIGKVNILDFGEDEACRASVLSRATAPETVNTVVPIKCATKKFCLSKDGTDCKEFIGEKKVENINLPVSTDETIDLIEKTYVEEMYRCWDVMGQGKLDLFSGGLLQTPGFTKASSTCVICSRIVTKIPDSQLKEEIDIKIDIKEYMRSTQVPGKSETYLNLFTDDSVNSFASVPSQVSEETADKLKDAQVFTFNSNTDEFAVLFTQIKPNDYGDTLGALGDLGLTIAGVVFTTPGLNKIAYRAFTFLGVVPGAVIALVGAGGITIYSMLNVRAGKIAAVGRCGSLTSKESAEEKGVRLCKLFLTMLTL